VLFGIGFGMLGAFAAAWLGQHVVSGSVALLAFAVGGAVLGWTGGVAAALRQERGDG
jgi:uncharacterized membrane protein (DUF485 family)